MDKPPETRTRKWARRFAVGSLVFLLLMVVVNIIAESPKQSNRAENPSAVPRTRLSDPDVKPALEATKASAELAARAREWDWARGLIVASYVASQGFVEERFLSKTQPIPIDDFLRGATKGYAIRGYAVFPLQDYSAGYVGDSIFLVSAYADPLDPETFGGRFKWECRVKYLGGESMMLRSWKPIEVKRLQ